MATIVSSNNEINNNMKIVNILGESDLLMKGVSKTITKLNEITKMWISQHVIKCIRCQFIKKSIER